MKLALIIEASPLPLLQGTVHARDTRSYSQSNFQFMAWNGADKLFKTSTPVRYVLFCEPWKMLAIMLRIEWLNFDINTCVSLNIDLPK